MALPTPVIPYTQWDGNEQSTANDVLGDDTIANGADCIQSKRIGRASHGTYTIQ